MSERGWICCAVCGRVLLPEHGPVCVFCKEGLKPKPKPRPGTKQGTVDDLLEKIGAEPTPEPSEE